MLQFKDGRVVLEGSNGTLEVLAGDEITRKLAMLFEGQCEGLGPKRAARKFGYSKQRYFQLLDRFRRQGAATPIASGRYAAPREVIAPAEFPPIKMLSTSTP